MRTDFGDYEIEANAFRHEVILLRVTGLSWSGEARVELKVRGRGTGSGDHGLVYSAICSGYEGNDGHSMHPSVTQEEIRDKVGWEIRFAEVVETTAPPTAGN